MANIPEVSLISSWHIDPPYQTTSPGPFGLIGALRAGQTLLDLHFLPQSDVAWYQNAAEIPSDAESKTCPITLVASLEEKQISLIAEAVLNLLTAHHSGPLLGPPPRITALSTYWPHISTDNIHLATSVRAIQNSLLLAKHLGCQHVVLTGGVTHSFEDLEILRNEGKNSTTQYSAPFEHVFRERAMAKLCAGLRMVFENDRGIALLEDNNKDLTDETYVCMDVEPGDYYIINSVESYIDLMSRIHPFPKTSPRVLLNVNLSNMFLIDSQNPHQAPQLHLIGKYNLLERIGHYHISDRAHIQAPPLYPGRYHSFFDYYYPWLKMALKLSDPVRYPRFSGYIAIDIEGCADLNEALSATRQCKQWLDSMTLGITSLNTQTSTGVIMAVDCGDLTTEFLLHQFGHSEHTPAFNDWAIELSKLIHRAHGSLLSITQEHFAAFFDYKHSPHTHDKPFRIIKDCISIVRELNALTKTLHQRHIGFQNVSNFKIALHEAKLSVHNQGPLANQPLGRDITTAMRLLSHPLQPADPTLKPPLGFHLGTMILITGRLYASISPRSKRNLGLELTKLRNDSKTTPNKSKDDLLMHTLTGGLYYAIEQNIRPSENSSPLKSATEASLRSALFPEVELAFIAFSEHNKPFHEDLKAALQLKNIATPSPNTPSIPSQNLEALSKVDAVFLLVGSSGCTSLWIDNVIELAMKNYKGKGPALLVALLLPEHPDFKKPYYDPPNVPPRLHEYVLREAAIIRKWSANPDDISTWLLQASENFKRVGPVVLSFKAIQSLKSFHWHD